MGPIGWISTVFDLVSVILDILDIASYNSFQALEEFLSQREVARMEHDKFLLSYKQQLLEEIRLILTLK